MMMLPEPTEVMPTRNPTVRPITAMPAKPFMVGGRLAIRSSILLWRQQQRRNHDQQHAHRGLDKAVDAVSIEVADVASAA